MARKSASSSVAPPTSSVDTNIDPSNGHLPPPAVPAGSNDTTATYDKTASDTSSDEGGQTYHYDFSHNRFATRYRNTPVPYDPSLLPNGSRSLSSIGLQAFCLGFTLAFTLCATAWCVTYGEGKAHTIWRLPAFFACLSTFHFLEYWTTATYNVPNCRAESFIIFSNGRAYNTAHFLATCEIVVSTFFPSYQRTLVYAPYTLVLGLFLVVFAQMVRSLAMATAGTNFNHTPVKTRKADHVLVTEGVYAWVRHPSYFGFFWWALGTQVLVGNKVCLVGYAVVLWTFFYRRIVGECLSFIDAKTVFPRLWPSSL